MNNNFDLSTTVSNPRLIAACYFCLLSLIVIFFLDSLFALKLYLVAALPTSYALLWGGATAAIFGALFGKSIIYAKQPYFLKTFLLGFFLIFAAMPLYDLGVMIIVHFIDPTFLNQPTLAHAFATYCVVLYYSYIYFGIWFAVLSGVAAMYLRGFLVYYCISSTDD